MWGFALYWMLSEGRDNFDSVKKKSIVVIQEKGVSYFIAGPVTLFLSVLRQNYTWTLFCLIFI